MTVSEAAARLRLQPVTLLSQVYKGHIPASRVGRFWRVMPEDIEVYRRTYHRPYRARAVIQEREAIGRIEEMIG